VKTHSIQIRTGALQNAGCALSGIRILNQEMDLLVCGEQTHDLRVNPWDGLKLPRPILRIVRPRKPRGFVRLPFGGHTVAQGARRC
jgi:hypothetical protein